MTHRVVALNEGRGINPGDTRSTFSYASGARESAQRRPGHQPRRHIIPHRQALHPRPRSTKAGASTPATPDGTTITSNAATALNEGRGINPGDTRPSGGKFNVRCSDSLNEGRGINPGDTRSEPRRLTLLSDRPLNEGRGINPGDTGQNLCAVAAHIDARSTKAGASTPATRRCRAPCPPSMRDAQRRPGHQPRRHTRRPCGSRPESRSALNEGRGINPGDTATGGGGAPTDLATLNEGRGINPGDTDGGEIGLSALQGRSTKAGASTPATHLICVWFAWPNSRAQRRPGHQPRRHSMPTRTSTGRT